MSTTEEPVARGATRVRIKQPEASPARGLHAKIAEVMALVQRVEKRGVNSEQRYDYATAEDISEMMRSKLGERGVTIFPTIHRKEIVKEPTGTTTNKGRAWLTWHVPIDYWFTDGETGQQMCVEWLGVADDYSDKGFAKALTAAEKFMLRQVFLISTGDDPEESNAGSSDEIAPAREAIQSARDHRTAASSRPAPRAAANLDELLTQENRRVIIGQALGAGIKEPSGKLDDALLRQIISAVSGGEVRRISEMTVGIASKVTTVIKRLKENPDLERANLESYFAEHPDHLPVVEPDPEPEPEPAPQQASLADAGDDDIPF